MQDDKNYVESILAANRKPEIIELKGTGQPFLALPNNWQHHDLEKYLPAPLRKKANVCLTTAESFVEYVKRHGSLGSCVVYVDANYAEGKVKMLAILNDNTEDEPAWRDHKATYNPPFSEEWRRWIGSNKQSMSQAQFAQFIEDNQKDIAGSEIRPSGAAMLEMALNMEARQEVVFKSAIRMESGTTALEYRDSEDEDTIKRMSVFDRFDIGIPVLFGGQPYRIEARLRYRIQGKATFWFELIRPDVTLESAVRDEIEKVKGAGFPVLFGNPFSS